MPFSTTDANAILNWMMGGSTLAVKSDVYMGLLTNDPEADEGSCAEIPAGFDTYARVLISTGSPDDYPYLMGAASKREIKNKAQINWTKAKDQQWPEVKGIALYTAKTGGSPFYYAKVPIPFTVDVGEVALFEAGAFKISMLNTDEEITDEEDA